MGETDFTQQGGLHDLSTHEAEIFDWLIMDGAIHDHTSGEPIPQFRIKDLDLFLGCATTDDPAHVAEVAVLFEMRGDCSESDVWKQIGEHLPYKPEGVWFDVTKDDRTHLWVVLSFTADDLEHPYLDYRMRVYIDFAQSVGSYFDDLYWLD